MNKTTAHDIVHQWYGGKSENCPSCNGAMDDSATMAEAKKLALANYKPKTNPLIPYEQRLNTFGEKDPEKKVEEKKPEEEESKMSEFTLNPLIDIYSFSEKTDELPSVIKVIPVGKYNMNRYGEVNITKEKIQEMAKHFNENIRAHTKQIGLPIDIEHGKTQYGEAAAGWLKDIEARDDGGYGKVSWTSLGKKLLSEKIYKLYSPEFHFKYKDPQYGFELQNVMTGGGLVNKPMIKDDLNPIVNSEENALLTNHENPNMLILELRNNSVRNYPKTMKLSEIAAKEKGARTSDEQKFLVEHKDELTLAEARKEGLLPVTEDKPTAGVVTMSEAEVKALKEAAAEGVAARQIQKRMEMKEKVKEIVFSDKGVKLPSDQVDTAVDLLMSMSEANQTKYLDQLKALPEKQILAEKGNNNEVTGTAATQDLETKIQEYMEKNKTDYAKAASAVAKQNPLLFQEYSENLPVALQER